MLHRVLGVRLFWRMLDLIGWNRQIHEHLADGREVVEYRDMGVIIRDRIRDLARDGATLAQVKAARPTADYDTRYGAISGPWTTDMFVEAVYNTVKR